MAGPLSPSYALESPCALTVKLSGRTTGQDQRHRRILSPSARGAQPPTRHGPLQRLLAVTAMPTAILLTDP
jgi:hypothetical protein